MTITSEVIAQLECAYRLITKKVPQVEVDNLDVVKKIDEYRRFWKPQETKVILLAESHVYTNPEDFDIKIDGSFLQKLPEGYPSRFVRFVYCLGYGENDTLTKKPKRTNVGTPQYWKIFSSCVTRNKHNLGFEKITRKTRRLDDRLQNKLKILNHLKEKGIWLLDASIVGLYGNKVKRSSRAYRQILKTCWDNYLRDTIEESRPEYIIVIGKRVEKVLKSRLHQLGIPFETLYQPQAHLTQEEHQKNFQRFNEVCSSIIKGEKGPLPTQIPQTILKAEHIRLQPNADSTIERKLSKLGYRKTRRSEWQTQDKIVHIVRSKNFGNYIRIKWREEWKNDHAIIYDYSKVNGPICVVPILELFNTKFVRQKRLHPSYANSGYWWTQKFSLNKPVAQFVLSYKDRWDIL